MLHPRSKLESIFILIVALFSKSIDKRKKTKSKHNTKFEAPIKRKERLRMSHFKVRAYTFGYEFLRIPRRGRRKVTNAKSHLKVNFTR